MSCPRCTIPVDIPSVAGIAEEKIGGQHYTAEGMDSTLDMKLIRNSFGEWYLHVETQVHREWGDEIQHRLNLQVHFCPICGREL